MSSDDSLSIAVLIPCHNEQATVAKVVDDFRRELPYARIYVFDNNSTDETAAIAAEHGATVFKEPRQGKGFAIQSMFERVDADVYVMTDGDDTYPADAVHKLIAPVTNEQADMVVGARLQTHTGESFRPLHVGGNHLVRKLVNWVSGADLTDIMSGYRAFNRRVVRCLPVLSSGFEVETEMTIQMLYHRMKLLEVQVPYGVRPAGSESKLRTFRDGSRVLWKIFSLFRSFKPLTFFGSMGIVFFVAGVLAGILPIHDYFTAPGHFVSHVPLAVLAVAFMLLSAGCVFLGILLHAINWRFLELHNVLSRK
ncbi:MAG: glycosyltransferase [Phycisphaerae bacterium]|nr:glycosyltransferase [Phycisphaerae bacterium]